MKQRNTEPAGLRWFVQAACGVKPSLVWFAVCTSWHLAGNEITFDPDVRKELCGN